ncbi:MAG: methionine aminotransferase [Flavobacteriales bacterium]
MPEFPNTVPSKLPKVGSSIFTVMSQKAREKEAINLSQGFPDFHCSPKLLERVHEQMKKGNNQYAPSAGIPELREAIAEKTEELYGARYDPETEVTVTAGGTEAIYASITSMVREDDEVVIFTPAYDCYEPAIELSNGKPIFVQLKPPEYQIDWNEVKRVINRKTRMMIINTPHNPTGSVIGKENMEQLEALTKNSDILILSDEVYEHVLFDGREHQSVCRFPGLAERSFVISSFGKTFHNTGWKTGYCLAPKNLMKEFRKTHQFIVFCSNTPIQHAFAEHLRENKEEYRELNDFYEKKRDHFLNAIESSRFKATPARGTYFQLLSYQEEEDLSQEKDTELALRLIDEYGIASVPVSVFYHHNVDQNVLRFCFAKSEETLDRAAAIINSI